MARIIEHSFPNLSQKVRIAQTKTGYLIEVQSLCKALFLDPSRLKCDPWVSTEEMVKMLLPFLDTHPAVRSLLHTMGEEGAKVMFPDGLTLAELSKLLGVSEAELLAEMPKILEKVGR
jgi:hypothetical protein